MNSRDDELRSKDMAPEGELDRSAYGFLAELGWRVPVTEAEVRRAEHELELNPIQLPEPLAQCPPLEPNGLNPDTGHQLGGDGPDLGL